MLNRYYNASGSVKGCPICQNHRTHPFTDCPALKARGFTVTHDSAADTNPDIGYGTKTNLELKVAARKAGTSSDFQSKVDQAVTAQMAAMEATIQGHVQARLAQIQSPAPPGFAPAPPAPPATVTGRNVLVTIPQGDFDDFTGWASPATSEGK